MAAKSVTNAGHHPVSHTARYPHSALESTMSRTFHPKHVLYFGDGSGRDTYCVVSNGGLSDNKKRYLCNCHEKMNIKSRNLVVRCNHIYHIYEKIYIMITQMIKGIDLFIYIDN